MQSKSITCQWVSENIASLEFPVPEPCLYFLQTTDASKAIKVGITNSSLYHRLTTIQRYHPVGLNLLSAFHSSDPVRLEKRIKKILAPYCSRGDGVGEWYKPHPVVLDVVKQCILAVRERHDIFTMYDSITGEPTLFRMSALGNDGILGIFEEPV